jgi:hypothetical protein
MEPYYIVVLDKKIGYCRLFRTDSENCPVNAVPLWQGHNLDIGYEEMIRQNMERRQIPSYHLSYSINKNGRKIFKIFKESPAKPWIALDLFHDYKLALSRMKELCEERRSFSAEVESRKKILMKRLQMKGKSLRLDAKGKRYVAWLLDSGTLKTDERENLLWLKENGVLQLSHP